MEENYEHSDRGRTSRDRRLDQLMETGRQLVDGVSGRRPGQRRAGLALDSVGRWVGDRVDWLLEDDEDWREPWQEDSKPSAVSGNRFVSGKQPVSVKQPLDAVSRRGVQPPLPDAKSTSDADWPEDESFRLDRWQRPAAPSRSESGPNSRRPLPRSSRRRD